MTSQVCNNKDAPSSMLNMASLSITVAKIIAILLTTFVFILYILDPSLIRGGPALYLKRVNQSINNSRRKQNFDEKTSYTNTDVKNTSIEIKKTKNHSINNQIIIPYSDESRSYTYFDVINSFIKRIKNLDESVRNPRVIPYCGEMKSYVHVDPEKNSDMKINKTIFILLWKKARFFSWMYNDNFQHCEYNNCRFTYNWSDYFKSAAVVFNSHQYLRIDCMPYKLKGQIWIYLATETPPYTPIFTKLRYANLFNWTWCYRRDCDIPAYYGAISSHNFTDIAYVDNITESKSKIAAIITSHCGTVGKRENYINKMKSVVDIYGKCGPYNVTRGMKHILALRILNTTYKFYLSFENSLCKDYITEKAFRVMRVNIVPVVRGGSMYKLYFPPHSYINVRDFSGPQNLSRYLQKLHRDANSYKKYYEWRQYYHSTKGFKWNICELCKRLNYAKQHLRLYEDIQEWWTGSRYKPFCNSKPNDFV